MELRSQPAELGIHFFAACRRCSGSSRGLRGKEPGRRRGTMRRTGTPRRRRLTAAARWTPDWGRRTQRCGRGLGAPSSSFLLVRPSSDSSTAWRSAPSRGRRCSSSRVLAASFRWRFCRRRPSFDQARLRLQRGRPVPLSRSSSTP